MVKSVQRQLLNNIKAETATEFSVRYSPLGEDGPTYLFVGSQVQLKGLVSLFQATRQLILEEEIGKIIGEPYERFVMKRPAPCGIQIHWRLTKSPPWEPQSLAKKLKLNKKYLPRPQCTIQNIDISKVTWEKIKEAAGGKNGYTWGRFYAHAQMVEFEGQAASQWWIRVSAASLKEAEERVEALASLSMSKIATMTRGERSNDKGRRKENAIFRMPDVKVYPAWFFVANYALVKEVLAAKGKDGSPIDLDKDYGRSTSLGHKFKKIDAIYLNKGKPSKDDVERLKELLRKPAPSN